MMFVLAGVNSLVGSAHSGNPPPYLRGGMDFSNFDPPLPEKKFHRKGGDPKKGGDASKRGGIRQFFLTLWKILFSSV